jgi:uncharacterized membrane protein YbhN (UPF0104 family)
VRGAPRLFAAPKGSGARTRRPTDVLILAASGAVLVVAAFRAGQPPTDFEAAVVGLLESLPAFLRPLWIIAGDLAVVWALVVVAFVVVRGRWRILRDLVLGLAATLAASLLVGYAAADAWPDVLGQLLHDDPPVDFPALALVGAAAVLGIASPHLSRGLRHPGRWLVALAALGWLTLGFSRPSEVVGAVALGWAVAAGIRLLFGSPGGVPSLADVGEALRAIGVDAEPTSVQSRRGVVWVSAHRTDGSQLDVKLYGRDAWDAQLLVSAWRFLWYRDGGPTLALTRLQQVEHEAFVTLLAERGGAPVAPVTAAGGDARGDALLATERPGRSLDEGAPVGEAVLASAWAALTALHRAGLVHQRIEPRRLLVAGDAVYLADLAGAEVDSSESSRAVDQAQLLVTTAVAVGTERAVAAAHSALGVEGLAVLSSYVQPAALTVALRRQADALGIDVDAVRAAVVATGGGEQHDLQRLRRLTWGRVLMAVLLFVAGTALVSGLADIGIDNIVEALQTASLPILLLAFVIGQTPRFANAVALSAASPLRVPLGRLTALQFAITFVNLAMPSTAARVAVNIRFFQRSGVEPTQATALGALDGFAGFVAQITLLITIPLLGLGTLSLDLDDTLSLSVDAGLLWVVLAIVAAGVAVVAIVPKLRNAVVSAARKVWDLLGPLLRSPRRLVTLYGANLTVELLFALCSYTVLRSFGQDVGYADVVLVNVMVALFAGLMPVPGGIGVTEAALTAGYVALGVDEATALAAAISYRMVTFYIPPTFGVLAFRWLQRQRYL